MVDQHCARQRLSRPDDPELGRAQASMVYEDGELHLFSVVAAC
ncbi:hypothetical protein [Streptomyces sp. NPDC001657]